MRDLVQLTDRQSVADEFVKFFKSVYDNSGSSDESTSISDNLFFPLCPESEVFDAISKLSSSKFSGPDRIPA